MSLANTLREFDLDFVFNSLCAINPPVIVEGVAPLRAILERNNSFEFLACGHKHGTPRNYFGNVRPGKKRRCEKCRQCQAKDFDPADILAKQRRETKQRKLRANLEPAPIKRHDGYKNWSLLAVKLFAVLGAEMPKGIWVPAPDYTNIEQLRLWVGRVAADYVYSNDDH